MKSILTCGFGGVWMSMRQREVRVRNKEALFLGAGTEAPHLPSKEEELLKELDDLKVELSQLRVTKVIRRHAV